jgi:16S rRNA (adenine1518-N6/adenine1519-N6)-dimethyltransferase
MKHKPRKRFGQNFLEDRAVLQRLAAAVAASPDDELIEIGPGEGALTALLLASGARVTAVELDRDLAGALRERDFGPQFTLVEGDALKTDFSALLPEHGGGRVVGNLPYNISTPLLFHLLDFRDRILDMHFLLQREVVQRLAASPGTKAYGRLSVVTQLHCGVEPLFEVAPEAFRPAPKVISQVVRLRPKPLPPTLDLGALDTLLRTAFSQRRKTLRKVLQAWFSPDQLQDLELDPIRRPDTLSVDEFTRLARHLPEQAA